jgi:hypothetical protein
MASGEPAPNDVDTSHRQHPAKDAHEFGIARATLGKSSFAKPLSAAAVGESRWNWRVRRPKRVNIKCANLEINKFVDFIFIFKL